jgi:hypothetical protein
MEKKRTKIGVILIVLALSLGMSASVQAIGVSFTFYGQVFDTDGSTPVDGVTVTVTNLATGSSVDPTVTASGGWYTVNLGNLKPNEAHSAGDNLQIVANDGACKRSTTVVARAATSPQQANVTLQADTTAPQLIGSKPAAGVCVMDGTSEICANYSDDTGINTSSVMMTVDGTDVASNATVTTSSVCYTPATSLAEGEHTVTVNVSDLCGHQNSTSWSFTVDTVAPAVAFIAPTPANDTEVTVDYVNVTVTATDEEGCGIDTVNLIWNGTVWVEQPPGGFMLFMTADTQYSFDVTGLANGEYTYYVQATDIAGNIGQTETRMVRINITAYTLTRSLASGFNIISPPLNDTAVANASTLATKIGANCSEVVRWNSASQAFISYVPGVPLNNFAIVGGEGYFVNLNNPTVIAFSGAGWSSPFAISLPTAFSIIGLPVNDVSVTNASTLAAKIGANCTELVKWNSATQSYVSYVTGVPLNNFATVGGEGYFANLNNPTEVTFVGAPWHD